VPKNSAVEDLRIQGECADPPIVTTPADCPQLLTCGMDRSRVPWHAMRYPEAEPSSISPLLTRWRSSLDEEPPRLANALRSEAQRCFRLARGIASFELADELEAMGRAFESEAKELETAPQMLWQSGNALEHLVAAE